MDGMAEFLRGQGVVGVVVWSILLFWIMYGICTSAGPSVGGWRLGNVGR